MKHNIVKLRFLSEIVGTSQISHFFGTLSHFFGTLSHIFGTLPTFCPTFRDILDRNLVFFRSEVDAESPTELRSVKIQRV